MFFVCGHVIIFFIIQFSVGSIDNLIYLHAKEWLELLGFGMVYDLSFSCVGMLENRLAVLLV